MYAAAIVKPSNAVYSDANGEAARRTVVSSRSTGLHDRAEGGSGDSNAAFADGKNWLFDVVINRRPSGLEDDCRLHCPFLFNRPIFYRHRPRVNTAMYLHGPSPTLCDVRDVVA